MQVQAVSTQYKPNFGTTISLETIKKANQTCIKRGKFAKRQGLTLDEYNALHREDYIHRIGDKTYDFYAIAEEIISKLRKKAK